MSTSRVNSLKLEKQVRGRIESLSYLPTTAAVAMKFVELGKDPETDPADYVKVISSDSSLSTKLLALANSSWFGVRNRVTRVQVAVNLLGLGTVRTMAISYCLTGLHSELRLSAEESRMFWAASLCKGVAARQFARRSSEKCAEEAFAAGLFQDFALPIMYSVARETMMPLLNNPALPADGRLLNEREMFRLDHAELGRMVAQKLELPELFVDAIAFHHDRSNLEAFVENRTLAAAAQVAALFPHHLDCWNAEDAQALREILAAHEPAIDPKQFLDEVQREFNTLYGYFESGSPPQARLTEMLEAATREVADTTTRLVGTVHELMQKAASAGTEVHTLLQNPDRLEHAAAHDPVTGLLNSQAFSRKAAQQLASAARYGASCALAFFGTGRLVPSSDPAAHQQAENLLTTLAEQLRSHLKDQDLASRYDGDQLVVLFYDRTPDDVKAAVEKLMAAPAAKRQEMSAGVVRVAAKSPAQHLESLITLAEGLMYKARHGGGQKIAWATLPTSARAA